MKKLSICTLATLAILISATAIQASSITIDFSVKEGEEAGFSMVNAMIYARTGPAGEFSSEEKAFSHKFDVDAGEYMAVVFTGADMSEARDANRPGAFLFQQQITVGDDEDKTVEVEFVAFDPEQVKGTLSGSGKVTDSDGNPVAGSTLKIVAFAQTAGLYNLTEVTTGEDGTFKVEGLADGVRYSVMAGDKSVGNLQPGTPLEINLPPQVGDSAPDFEFTSIETGKQHKFSEFKGKVIVLDFWATWCGPCQVPTGKLNTYREKHPEWGDRVVLLALSIDEAKETVVDHLEKNGWKQVLNGWAGEGGWQSTPPKKYGVRGIPSLFIIDQAGKIVFSGHPMTVETPEKVAELLGSEAAEG